MSDATIPRAIAPENFPWFDYSRYTFSLGLDLGDIAIISGHSASEYSPDQRRVVVRGGMREQTATAYAKIETILSAAGYGLGDVVRVVEYVTARGIDDHADAVAVRGRLFGQHVPVVNTVCVNSLLRPDALVEIEVTASRSRAGLVTALDGLVHLPSILPLDRDGRLVGEGDVVAQSRFCFDRAEELLEPLGLSLASAGKIVDYITPRALSDYKGTGRVRRERLGPVFPGSTGIIMARLAHPGALIQLDITATRQPLTAINPGWTRYEKLTYSPAVRAGSVIFLSGQAALDPQTERAVHAADIVAQAEYTYSNILRVLEAAGAGPESLVKTIEYVTPQGMTRYRDTAGVRSQMLRAPYPASTGCICEGLLRPEFEIEIDAMAILPAGSS